MIERTKNWPGKATDAEITALSRLAREAGVSPSNYLRDRLGFGRVDMGAPTGNRNAAAKQPKRNRQTK